MSSTEEDWIINERYKLLEKIGSGSFGEIFQGFDIINNEDVAIKIEKSDLKHPRLKNEFALYNLIKGDGVPSMLWYGEERNKLILVMDLLGPSLEELFEFSRKRFSLKTVLMLADQMIQRIEFLHSKNLIHRDIKPDNFLIGRGSLMNRIYVVDFGLTKYYIDPKTENHIVYKEGRSITGTVRYISQNIHRGFESSRKDDLLSLGYILIYFLMGRLPWQGIKGSSRKQKYEKICEKKISTSYETLCKGFPNEFILFFEHCDQTSFYEAPNYNLLKFMFRELYAKMNYDYNGMYDWSLKHRSAGRLRKTSFTELELDNSLEVISKPVKTSPDKKATADKKSKKKQAPRE